MMRFPALKPLVHWSVLTALATLTASCATMTPSVAVTTRTACGVFGPLGWSRKDTLLTVEGIKEHNAAGVEVCGWK